MVQGTPCHPPLPHGLLPQPAGSAGMNAGAERVLGILEALLGQNFRWGPMVDIRTDGWVFQFCQIGDYAMTAFAAGVHKDVPPYVMAAGYRAEPAGLNTEGMRRNGFDPAQIGNVKNVYKTLYRQGLSLEEAKAEVLKQAETAPELAVFRTFFETSTRGIIR